MSASCENLVDLKQIAKNRGIQYPLDITARNLCKLINSISQTTSPVATCDDILASERVVQRDRALISKDAYFKVTNKAGRDVLIKLKNCGVTPKILDIRECSTWNKFKKRFDTDYIIKTEQFDGNLADWMETNPQLSDVQKEFYKIARLHYKLSAKCGLTHGDHNPDNIVYKKTPYGMRWALVDFEEELSTTNPYHSLLEWGKLLIPYNILFKNIPPQYVHDWRQTETGTREKWLKEMDVTTNGPTIEIDVNLIR